MAGVVSTGFDAKTTSDLVTELETAEKAEFGNTSLNVRATSVLGILNGIFGAKLAELWEVAEAVYNNFNPDGATGRALDQLCAITGITRQAARKSTVTLTYTGTNATVVPAGTRFQNSATNTYWVSTEAATIAAGTATAAAESADYGEIAGLAGDIDTIDTPVSGLTTVNNAADATEGRDEETDAAFRIRRELALQVSGSGTIDAIRSAVLDVTGINECYVYENSSNATDADSLPAHSFEVVVDPGSAASASILGAIWENKAAGISAFARSGQAVTGYVTDDSDTSQVVGYTSASAVSIYCALTAVTGSDFVGATATLVTNIKSAIVSYGDSLLIADDVVRSRMLGDVTDVQGIYDCTDFRLGTSASPTATANIAIGTREIASIDSSNVAVAIQ